jgi:hypothetical protein
MGQYFQAVLMKGNSKKTFESYDFGNGAKLTEHSYISNSYVESIVKYMLKSNGGVYRVAWVGDYADEYIEDGKITNPLYYDNSNLFGSKYSKLYDDFYKYRMKEHKKVEIEEKTSMENSLTLCIVNHTKKEYVDVFNYVFENGRNDSEGWFIFHPLPLLTAIGNGYGGGDYYGLNMKEYVGYWACDEIEIMKWVDKDKYPDYKELKVRFKECHSEEELKELKKKLEEEGK